ncbi:hypothetical protein [Xanthobacter oligotrophicus]|uniref:hypothetical protein n=1 Tax=Xanthobacter oligotrophicus TaxID=2607286 RepID=UPI00165EAEAE|nr:hypothetical protein [Xanthobacter oligotrophicus]MCG5235477.1 hypothetical protein [Xanthobacter oligotrophicus]
MWLDDLRPLHFGAPAESERLNEAAYQAFGIAGLGASVADVVGARLPFGQLRIFSRSPQPRRRVLVVAPMAGAYPFLMRDLVMALLDVADAVAVTEWPNARYVPVSAGRFGFAENCVETAQMARALAGDVLAGDTGGIHIIGVCQGALPAFAAACLLAEAGTAPASLSLIGGPIDPSRNPTRLWRVLQERSLEALERQVIETVSSAFPGAGRRIFPAWRQIDAFALYLWRQSLSGGDLPFRLAFDDGDDPVRFPLARLCWSMMDVAGEFFMENVETVFRENALARDRLTVAGHEVRAEALSTTALLTVEGEVDDISARTQTEAAHDLCVNIPAHLKRQIVVPNAGHFALFYGRRMRETVLPALAEVMQAAESAVRPAA